MFGKVFTVGWSTVALLLTGCDPVGRVTSEDPHEGDRLRLVETCMNEKGDPNSCADMALRIYPIPKTPKENLSVLKRGYLTCNADESICVGSNTTEQTDDPKDIP